ncbi:small ribosomal subunit protein mS23-like [Diadema setosum]|uniref:small ribosomal subunit protein mS23-like n=1 Tax=Diadema setosum TaxID=31175 RepID=UPI003B3A3F20
MTSLSRLEKLGTIFTRVRDLIRAGVMKPADKPVWYDVMAAFPPKQEPTFHQSIDPEPLQELLYPEDRIRAKFYQTYRNQQTIDLTNQSAVQQSICYRYIQKYQELEAAGSQTEEELMVATEAALAAEGINLRRKGAPQKKPKEEARTPDAPPELGGLAKLLKDALNKNEIEKT